MRIRNKILSAFCAATLALGAGVSVLHAQGFTSDDTGLKASAVKAGYSTNLSCQSGPGGCIPFIIGSIVNALLGIFGALFLVLIIWGGFQYMTAQGDDAKVKKAQETIRNAIIGMLIVAASYAIASFVLKAVTGISSGTP
ncbi:MAG: pilin [Patescibacteria group bacterium]